MTGANDTQVGGTHYQSKYQHWDYVTEIGLPYVLGCATKYLTRWRSKNGVEDLRKSMHYIEKAIETGLKPQTNILSTRLTELFIHENLSFAEGAEADAIRAINAGNFPAAIASIRKIIADASEPAPLKEARDAAASKKAS